MACRHTETCCCNHGGRCSCGGKKEPALGTVPESDSEAETGTGSVHRSKAPLRRRRANTVHSDALLSFDENGHRKPATKHNRASQKTGPYQLNRVNSANSAGSFSGVDASEDGTCATQRRVKSEAASPLMTGSGFAQLNSNLKLDLETARYQSFGWNGSVNAFGSGLPGDNDPLFSAGLDQTPVDWSYIERDRTDLGSYTPSSFGQNGQTNFAMFHEFGSGSEQIPPLAGATSTSGEVSEAEDFISGGDLEYESFGLPGPAMLPGDTFGCDGLTLIPSAVEDDPAFFMPHYNNDRDETIDSQVGAAMLSFQWDI
jgi:hypothetical protein